MTRAEKGMTADIVPAGKRLKDRSDQCLCSIHLLLSSSNQSDRRLKFMDKCMLGSFIFCWSSTSISIPFPSHPYICIEIRKLVTLFYEVLA